MTTVSRVTRAQTREAQENRASKLGEKLINDGAHASAEQRSGSGHAVAHDCGNCDGSCQDRQNLLECEYQHLTELGLVFDAVDQIHNVSSVKFSIGSIRKNSVESYLKNYTPFGV